MTTEQIQKEAAEHAKRVIALGWHKNNIEGAIAGAWESGYVFGSIDESASSPSPEGGGEDEKDLIIAGLEEGSEMWKAEYDNCREILEKLVELKALKGTFGSRIEGQQKMFEMYWEKATEFIKKYQHL